MTEHWYIQHRNVHRGTSYWRIVFRSDHVRTCLHVGPTLRYALCFNQRSTILMKLNVRDIDKMKHKLFTKKKKKKKKFGRDCKIDSLIREGIIKERVYRQQSEYLIDRTGRLAFSYTRQRDAELTIKKSLSNRIRQRRAASHRLYIRVIHGSERTHEYAGVTRIRLIVQRVFQFQTRTYIFTISNTDNTENFPRRSWRTIIISRACFLRRLKIHVAFVVRLTRTYQKGFCRNRWNSANANGDI